jgi:class 3 adenylate cyclase
MVLKFESFQEISAVYTFVDVRGFTQWSRKNQGEMRKLAAIIYNIADEVCESKAEAKYRRRVVKNLGDGCFCVNEYKKDQYAATSNVVSFMQVYRFYHYFHEAIRQSNIHGKKELDIGFGLTYGASHRFYTKGEATDYIGEKVNLASRFCGKAEAGQLVFESDMKDYYLRATGLLDLGTPDIEEHKEQLKGYGEIEYLTSRLSFSTSVLRKIYSIGHDPGYIQSLLKEL